MWKAYRKRKIINNSKMICELNEIYVSLQKSKTHCELTNRRNWFRKEIRRTGLERK